MLELKIVNVARASLEAIAGAGFSLIDPGGMRWFGQCHAEDHGPNDYYAVVGTVTSGPTEWVGLRVVIHGHYDGETVSVEPESLHLKRLDKRLPQRPGGPLDYGQIKMSNIFEPGSLVQK